MKSLFQKMNKEIAGLFRQPDQKLKKGRAVMFWFYSDQEENVARLAAHLQNNRYIIHTCEYSETHGNYLCIAEAVMPSGNDELARLCVDMQIVAEKMEAEFFRISKSDKYRILNIQHRISKG